MPTEDLPTTRSTREEVRDSTAYRSDRVPGPILAQRITYYIGGALLVLLALRFILALLGANRANPFADLIFSLSAPFVAPFFGLFAYEPIYGQFAFETGTLIAMVVYGALIAGIARLFTLGRRDRDVA